MGYLQKMQVRHSSLLR